MSDLLEAADDDAALEELHQLECTDGLPVIIPTPERVERLILTTGMDPDMVLGEMGPMLGIATVEKVAVNAVMAGCTPDHMPLVIAAAQAIADPRFDLMEMQATTHCTAPLVIVNGPARHDCGGLNSSFGALGSGNRANASIGRAVRLCMINIGGGRPGSSDMAVHGHPGKYSYCLAEAEERSPFPPLHVSRGFEADDSVVTVIGCEAPHSVIYSVNADDPKNAAKLLHVLSVGIANLATNHAVFTAGVAVVVLGPGHADVLANAGMSREDIAQRLWELTHLPVADLNRYGGQFGEGRYAGEETYCTLQSPQDFLILVAGGEGLYSMVMPSWGGGAHNNIPVSMKAEMDLFCEVPGLAEPKLS